MTNRAALCIMLAVAGVATVASADDSPSARPIQTHRQLMKQCMAEQQGKTPGTSADEMKKTCEERVKSYRDHPSATTPETAPHS